MVHAGNSYYTYAMKEADRAVITPLIYDPGYIDFLLEYCSREKINALLSVFDIDLRVLAVARERFAKENIRIVISDWETINNCFDKWLMCNLLSNNAIRTPKSYLNLDDINLALRNREITFPMVIKPRWGAGSLGVFETDEMDELLVFKRKIKKIISNSYLKFESANDPENNIIFQEKIAGEEYGLDVFNDLNGNFLTCIPKKKLRMRAGETDAAVVVSDESLFDLGRKLSLILRHIGNLDIDVIMNGGKWNVIDINCRFGGQYPFSHLAGVDFPKAIVNMLMDKPVTPELIKANFNIIGCKDVNPVILPQGHETHEYNN